MSASKPVHGVLFDLDGTLADSAPDLVAALASLCIEIGAPPPDAAQVSKVVSAGGRAILRRGLPAVVESRIEELLPRYLDLYAARGNVSTYLTTASRDADGLDSRGIPWGIVTNKTAWLAQPC